MYGSHSEMEGQAMGLCWDRKQCDEAAVVEEASPAHPGNGAGKAPEMDSG